MKRLLASVAGAVLAATGLSSCNTSDQYLVIGAFNFGESQILSQIYEIALQDAGVPATIKELTTREVLTQAMRKGQIELVPEYLGTFTEYLNATQNGPDAAPLASSSTAKTYANVQPLAANWGLTVLTPSKAQNQNAYATTEKYAQENNLETLEQLGTFSQSNPVQMGGPPECQTRPACMPGLEKLYDIKFSGFTALDAGGPLTVQALVQDKIQLGVVFTSSGVLATNNLKILKDTKGLSNADNITPVMNSESVTPQIQQTLDAVSAALTTEDLQQMNADVEIDRQDPRAVAEQWLQANGLR